MSRIRAVVYGVGAMNSIVTRMLLEKGVDIVGALARSPEKVGQDLGTVAGLGREIGVIIEDDAEKLFSSRTADIAVVAVSSYMDGLYEHLRVCAEHGVNAVTIGEEALYPWNTSPVLTAELDALAKQNNCTISASGCQDTFWVNIVNLLMGAAHRVDSVVGRASWNVDDFGPEVAADQRVGSTAADFESWVSNAGDRPPTFGRNVLDALVADAGLTIGKITNSTRPDSDGTNEVGEPQCNCATWRRDWVHGHRRDHDARRTNLLLRDVWEDLWSRRSRLQRVEDFRRAQS